VNRAAGLALAAIVSVGCGHRAQVAPRLSTQADWTRARADLDAMRKALPSEPYVEVIRVLLREPTTGKVLEGRGAVAVDPKRAMRLVLVGPGGSTALDVWLTRDAWRFSIPALEMTRRGDTRESLRASKDDDSAEKGLPIGFFRWWFLEPLDGRLLAAVEDGTVGRRLVLREDGATVTLWEVPPSRPSPSRRHYVAIRREAEDVDRLEWLARSMQPRPGDRAYYMQRSTGLRVEIVVEALSESPPDPEAFIDPDAGSEGRVNL
jgi:hypothetical protein